MARGLKSKVVQRNKRVKRQLIQKVVVNPRVLKSSKLLKQVDAGTYRLDPRKKNAFLYPDDPNAEIPKVGFQENLDFRSESVVASGFAAIGNRRKYTSEEKLLLDLPPTMADFDEALHDSRQKEMLAVALKDAFGDESSDQMGKVQNSDDVETKRQALGVLESTFANTLDTTLNSGVVAQLQEALNNWSEDLECVTSDNNHHIADKRRLKLLKIKLEEMKIIEKMKRNKLERRVSGRQKMKRR